MAADAPGGAKALIDGLAGLIGIGVFGLVAAAGFGAFSEGDPAPLPVQLAESELALAYARAAPGYRCRSAEQGGAWYVLCAASGPSGGALFAVLAAAPGKTRASRRSPARRCSTSAQAFSPARTSPRNRRFTAPTPARSSARFRRPQPPEPARDAGKCVPSYRTAQ